MAGDCDGVCGSCKDLRFPKWAKMKHRKITAFCGLKPFMWMTVHESVLEVKG